MKPSFLIGTLLCVLLCSQLGSCSSDHVRGEASHVEFKLEKIPESDTMYKAADEPSIMQTLSDNLQAAKDAIASTVGMKGADTTDDVKHNAQKMAHDAKYHAQKVANKAGEMKDDTVDTLSDKARQAMDTLQEKMQEARDAIGVKLHGAGETIEATADQGKANLQSVGDKISSKAADLKSDAATNYEQAKDATKENLQAAYLKMKEAYERLAARMNELKHDTQEAAYDAKAELQDKAADVAKKAQKTAHEVQSKSKDAVYSAKENVDHTGNRASRLFSDAYASIQDTFNQMGARLHHTKPEKVASTSENVKASVKESYENLATRMAELSLAAKARLGLQGDTNDVADSDIRTMKLNVQELTDRIEGDLPARNALFNYLTEAYHNVGESYKKMMGHDEDDSRYHVQSEDVGMMESAKEKMRTMGERVADAVGYKTQKDTDRGL